MSELYCSGCRSYLAPEAFRPDPKATLRGGRFQWCRGCVSRYGRQWREANPAVVARYQERARERYAAAHPVVERRCANPECRRSLEKARRDKLTCSQKCRDRCRYLKRTAEGS